MTEALSKPISIFSSKIPSNRTGAVPPEISTFLSVGITDRINDLHFVIHKPIKFV